MIGPGRRHLPDLQARLQPRREGLPARRRRARPAGHGRPRAQAAAPAGRARAAAAARGKICPTCGGAFDGVAAFCGKDGTQLVLLN